MKNENEKLDNLFQKLEHQWDIEEIGMHHQERFLAKLNTKKQYKKYFIPLSIAASIAVLLGIFVFYTSEVKTNQFQFASKETRQTETDSEFTKAKRNSPTSTSVEAEKKPGGLFK